MAHLHTPKGTVLSYTIGFVFSLVITFLAYDVAVNRTGSVWALSAIVLGFAVLQLFVQLYYFLHVGQAKGSRWNVVVLLFAILVILIIGVGSIWIMNNLNYNMASPADVTNSIIKDEGIHQ